MFPLVTADLLYESFERGTIVSVSTLWERLHSVPNGARVTASSNKLSKSVEARTELVK